MTIWTNGGMYGQVRREIVSEDGRHPIATVRVKQYLAGNGTEPWPEGEANFRLILQAPVLLEALEEIADLSTDDLWRCYGIARAAIAAVKGKDEETNT